MGDAERIMEMPRTQSYHEPRGPYYIRIEPIFGIIGYKVNPVVSIIHVSLIVGKVGYLHVIEYLWVQVQEGMTLVKGYVKDVSNTCPKHMDNFIVNFNMKQLCIMVLFTISFKKMAISCYSQIILVDLH